ncbi:MAG: NAD-dependent epimerase/dehydratase family protein [Saprospiraceae bacterium]
MQLSKSRKTATVVGATGLVGSFLLQHLEQDAGYAEVYAISRSKPHLPAGSRVEWIKMPSDLILSSKHEAQDLARLVDVVPEGSDFFSCLGTTKAKAGSAEAFSAIDYQLNLVLAKAALHNEYAQYLLVSSAGADPRSSFLYNQVKGKLELAIKSLPFWSIHLFQPSVLVGSRNENRWGEKAAETLLKFSSKLLGNTISKYRPIEAEQVALCMILAARETSGGISLHSNSEMNVTAVGKDLKTL